MDRTLEFDAELLARYDPTGPRYTSYPSAAEFHSGFDAKTYREAVRSRPADGRLSVYVHVPFCRTLCFYCACNKAPTKNRGKIQPYLEHLNAELERQAQLFGRHGVVEQVHLGGGTPTFLDGPQIGQIFESLRWYFDLADDTQGEYSIEIDPRNVAPERISQLRALGFNRLSLGVQDFDPAVQQAVNRRQSEAETWSVLEAARSSGFRSINLDLIYGLPFQSVASFTKTLQKVVAARPDRIAVFNYAHLPAMFKPQLRIDTAALPTASEKLSILEHTIGHLLAAGYVHIGMDHFALPHDELALAQDQGTLHRNFQGYSTRDDCDLLALGPSAIGRVGSCYAQNARDLPDYYRRVDNAGLAIFRGIELSEQDLLHREIINELICNFSLDIARLEQRHDIDFAAQFAAEREQLTAMADDGLLAASAARVQVLPRGRLLIRNICMVFDSYRRAAAEEVRFSRVI